MYLSTLNPHECLVFSGDFNITLKVQDYMGRESTQEVLPNHFLVDIWYPATLMPLLSPSSGWRKSRDATPS